MPVQASDGWVAVRLTRWNSAQDAEALGELLKWQRDRAFAVARRILGNDAESEDAVQQAFLKLFRSGPTFEATEHFLAAVYRSVTHAAIDLARNRQARRLVEHAMSRHDRTPSPTPRQTIEDREALRLLQEEMQTLPAEDRALLALCCQEGLSLAAAAESLELPRETARDRLARLLTDLRKRLARRGVALSLLLLIGLFQHGRMACASDSLCTALNAALPGAACASIAPAAAAGVSGTALLAQAGIYGGLFSSLLAGKAVLVLAAATFLGAGIVTWSAATKRPGSEPPAAVPSEIAAPTTIGHPAPGPMPAPLTTAPAAAPAVVDEVPPAPIVPGEANVNPPVELPDAIRDAAQLAVAHLNITSVEREVRKGRVVYDVKGRDDGRFVEIEIAEDGHVIKIERKDEDEDDDEKKPMPPPVEPNSSETGVF